MWHVRPQGAGIIPIEYFRFQEEPKYDGVAVREMLDKERQIMRDALSSSIDWAAGPDRSVVSVYCDKTIKVRMIDAISVRMT